ncbi:DUF1294 domain-containing protein [Sedimentibacter sp.]|uniref:DUF1294 domain-containing protein n=1 Tax=Sedimentibacter sp. TaxID=1960295 RepID=UPI0028A953F3|nr:DUF1294 domain-containing protein [Sedimentibacter sp.]
MFLLLTNTFTFLLYVADKRKALKGKRRISEKTLLIFTILCGGIGALLGMYFAKHKTRSRKFKFVAAIGLIITLIPVIHIVHGLTLSKIIRYVEIEFSSENWPPESDGYRIAFMSDMHAITDEDMSRVAAELNDRNLDLLLSGGDFLMEDDHYIGTVREMAQINTTDGIFGVEGNHDDYKKLFRAQDEYGIKPLDNSGTRIREGFYLAGVHDMYNRNPDIKEAVEGANPNDFVLLLSHSPDLSMKQPTDGIDLILSGHTHAGQITFFGYPFYLIYGSLPITDYGTRFAYGFARSAYDVPVFTTSGTGTFSNIPRIFTRPEVVIFTMYTIEGVD